MGGECGQHGSEKFTGFCKGNVKEIDIHVGLDERMWIGCIWLKGTNSGLL
jgi:hypothetical protein